jgi:hypothetical protein
MGADYKTDYLAARRSWTALDAACSKTTGLNYWTDDTQRSSATEGTQLGAEAF